MSTIGNDQKFKDVSFTMPQETEEQRKLRLEEMSSSLMNMINEVKGAVALTDDASLKDQLHAVTDSLHNVLDKVERAKQ